MLPPDADSILTFDSLTQYNYKKMCTALAKNQFKHYLCMTNDETAELTP